MAFNSISFLCFLTILIVLNIVLAQKYRPFLLFVASIFFVAYFSLISAAFLLLSTFFTYLIAFKIQEGKWFFIGGTLLNVLPIIIFNYLSYKNNEFALNLNATNFDINSTVFALGISFYSLQNISYLNEVKNQKIIAEKNFINRLLYNGFFPKIICGPILKPNEFIQQIKSISVTKEDLMVGFQRILLGLFKKMVVADRLAPAVASVFDYNDTYSGATTLTAIYLFTIQLYFDFSAYIDIAIGVSKALGIKLPENFNFPLRSSSVSEFWRRWHITLINWFTNYIYYPLVYYFRDWKKGAVIIGIVTTFLISGIWHGIGLTFFAWAACHAVYLTIELFTKKMRLNLKNKIPAIVFKIISVFIVFNLVCFSNIFFRADSFSKAIQLIKNIFSSFIPADFLSNFIAPLAVGGHQEDVLNFCIIIIFAAIFLLFERRIFNKAINPTYQPLYIIFTTILILLFGVFNAGERFIYMQF